jgi:hypothetical protein
MIRCWSRQIGNLTRVSAKADQPVQIAAVSFYTRREYAVLHMTSNQNPASAERPACVDRESFVKWLLDFAESNPKAQLYKKDHIANIKTFLESNTAKGAQDQLFTSQFRHNVRANKFVLGDRGIYKPGSKQGEERQLLLIAVEDVYDILLDHHAVQAKHAGQYKTYDLVGETVVQVPAMYT